MVKKYLAVRKPLKALVLIMDIRRGPETEEINLLSYLNSISLHSIPVLTKADKFSRSGQLRQTHRIVGDLPEALFKTEFVLFSSKTRQGKDALWERIAEVLPEVCR
jgi:GTP-binding protein